VHDHVPVAVLHATDDLLEEMPGLVLRQPPLLNDVVKQLATLHIKNTQRAENTYIVQHTTLHNCGRLLKQTLLSSNVDKQETAKNTPAAWPNRKQGWLTGRTLMYSMTT
jgi:hypothetical protein